MPPAMVPSPEKSSSSPPSGPTAVAPAAGIFLVLFCALWPVHDVLATRIAIPALGSPWSFLLQMTGLFLVIWGALELVLRHEEDLTFLEGGRFRGFLRRVNRTTGQEKRGPILTVLCAIATVVAMIQGAWRLVPLGAVPAFALFWQAARTPKERWAVLPFVRNLPASLPSLPVPGPGEEGDVRVDLTWEFPRISLSDASVVCGEGRARLVIRSEDIMRARESNPTRGPVATLLAEESTRHAMIRELACNGPSTEIPRLAGIVGSLSAAGRFFLHEELACLLGLVQSIPLRSDEESLARTDYWRYPVETLADRAGDSIDRALLLAALMHHLYGEPAEPARRMTLLFLVDWANRRGAVAVGGATLALPEESFSHPARPGERLYFCDPEDGGKIGGIPTGTSVECFEIVSLWPS